MTGRTWLTPDQIARAKRLHEQGHSYGYIAGRIGCEKSTIGKLKARGWRRTKNPRCNPQPAPGDLSLMAGRLRFNELLKHYRVGHERLRGWLDEKGIEPTFKPHRNTKRPVPDDFAEVAKCLPHTKLIEHYRASSSTVGRWRRESGLIGPRQRSNDRKRPKRIVSWAETYTEGARA
jgi:hypothetical protein